MLCGDGGGGGGGTRACFGLALLLRGDKNKCKTKSCRKRVIYVQSYLHEDTVKGTQAGEGMGSGRGRVKGVDVFFPSILYNVIEIIIKRKPSPSRLCTNGRFVRKTVTLQRFARFDNHFISAAAAAAVAGRRRNTTSKINSRVASDNSITPAAARLSRSCQRAHFFFHLSEPIARGAHTPQRDDDDGGDRFAADNTRTDGCPFCRWKGRGGGGGG